MTPELERAVKRYRQWFGSYKKSVELVKVQVWLTINNGQIEFLTSEDSYKVKRVRANPRVVCYLGSKDGPSIAGTAEIVMGSDAMWRSLSCLLEDAPVSDGRHCTRDPEAH